MRHVIIFLAATVAATCALAQSPYPRPAGWEWYGTAVPNGTVGVQYTSGGATLVGGPNGGGAFIGRNFGQPSPNGIPMNEAVRAPIGGNSIAMNGARLIPLLEVANGAAALYTAWTAGQWVGSQIADYLDLGTRVTPTNAGWQFDTGQAPTSTQCNAYPTFDPFVAKATCSAQQSCDSLVASQKKSAADPSKWGPAFLTGSGSGLTCKAMAGPDSTVVSTVLGMGEPATMPAKCAAFTDFFNAALSRPEGSNPDPDGKCPTGRYNGVPFNDARERMRLYGDPTALPGLIPKIIEEGYPFAGEPMPSPLAGFPGGLAGPASLPGPIQIVETTPSGGGAPVSTVNNTIVNYTYTGGNTVTVSNTTVTNNPGGGTTTTTTTPEIKLCGVPGSPACKIDETGTPTAGVAPGAINDITQRGDQLKDAVKGITAPTLPWTFGLSLPAGSCSALTFGAGGGRTWQVDLCSNSLIIFLRNLLAWALGIATAIYCWRSFTIFSSR